ncbi:ATP-binding protein [Halorientalis brevis]|uniref:histidine kinase n=1 Tax=Halorientalis brevis TaxID=1126241 RepID=A0ABD6CAN3_9EURY|nr:PAS domain-containing sensor histidine kinase [Halorientalis brevis]
MTGHSNERRHPDRSEQRDPDRGSDDRGPPREPDAAVFEHAPIPIVVQSAGPEPTVDAVNPAFEELFGYTADELPAQPIEDVLAPADEDADAGPSVVDQASTLDGDPTSVTLDTRFGQREFYRFDRGAGADHTVVYLVDRTTEHHQRERLAVVSRVLRHDSRNQLNVVTGMASMLADSVDEETRAQAEQAVTAAAEFRDTCEQIRRVEEVIATDTARRPIDVTRLVADVVSDLQDAYPDCSFTTEPSEPVWVTGSAALGIALENVVENAVAHNDRPEPSVEITAVESLDGRYVDVRVADDGPGIPPAEYEILTGERDRSQVEHLSGLGLYVSHWIVTALGGTLGFDANAPRGSIVTLRVPSAVSPSESNPR